MISYSSQTLLCNPIKYTMFVIESTAENPVDIFWNLDYNDYEMNPQDFTNRGEYTVLLRSCVPVGAKSVCVLSEPWIVTVYDPCGDTSIVSAGWTRVLEAPILQSAALDYATQIQFEGKNFPW